MQEQTERRSRQQGRAKTKAARGGMPKLIMGGRKRQAQATAGEKAQASASRAEDAGRAAREAFGALKLQPVMYAGITGHALPAQKLVAEASGFNIRHRDWVYPRDLEFSWRGNVRIAIHGSNGSGKSSLLQAMRGAPLSARGRLQRGDLVTVFLDQHHTGLRDELSVLGNVALRCSGSEGQLRDALAQFLFRGDSVHQVVGTLSGGERLRVAVAMAFLRAGSPQLMLLDEPTNNLDAENVEFLEEIVRGFRGAVVMVSHDQRFLQRCGVTGEFVVGA